MQNSIVKKYFILGIILLFFGIGVLPSICGDVEDNQRTDKIDFLKFTTYVADTTINQQLTIFCSAENQWSNQRNINNKCENAWLFGIIKDMKENNDLITFKTELVYYFSFNQFKSKIYGSDYEFIVFRNFSGKLNSNIILGNFYINEIRQFDPLRYVIYNSRGYQWPASGEYIQIAIDDLNGSGEVWLPEATLDVYNNIYISYPGIKIHGQGYDKTVINFHNARLISSKNPYSGSDATRFRSGLDNIQLDNFKFTGDGNLELTLGKNTKLFNIIGENITCGRPGAFRFIIPTGTKYANSLIITNCHAFKTHSHGFFINALASYCKIENVTFSNCTGRYAGWPYPANNQWSVGFNLCEYYGSNVHGDMTIKNVLIKNCTAEYNWESGFHFEVRPNKINVTLDHCLAQYNGQKWYFYNESYRYMSGFIGLLKDITLKDCISNYNTHYGYQCSTATGFSPAVFINCKGIENFDGLSNKQCNCE